MQRQWIVSNPKVMMGKPVIAGTRITVELILEKLATGETIEQILEAHPQLVAVPCQPHSPIQPGDSKTLRTSC